MNTRTQIGWEVKRSDGRRFPYTWGMDEKQEAEKVAAELPQADQPFSYRVVAVMGEALPHWADMTPAEREAAWEAGQGKATTDGEGVQTMATGFWGKGEY